MWQSRLPISNHRPDCFTVSQTNAPRIQIESRSPPEMIEKARRLRTVRLASEGMQEKVRKIADSYVLIAEKNQQLFDEFKEKYRDQLPPTA